jgi:hypothetical protein
METATASASLSFYRKGPSCPISVYVHYDDDDVDDDDDDGFLKTAL